MSETTARTARSGKSRAASSSRAVNSTAFAGPVLPLTSICFAPFREVVVKSLPSLRWANACDVAAAKRLDYHGPRIAQTLGLSLAKTKDSTRSRVRGIRWPE